VLLRWEKDAIPLLTLEELIAVADDTCLIVPIGAWFLGAACAQFKTWQQAGLPGVRVALRAVSA
jgi:EAL domain-containing protein (putative c-di-GMP-specific phosphodiesterase class I)